MASIANVALTDTFDEWRTKTNQLINVYDETNELARASYNATNLAAVTAANLAANVITGNSGVYVTISDNANTITYNVLTTIIPTFYDAANAAYDQSNTAITTSDFAYGQANTARDTANITYDTANSAVFIANLSYDTANNFVANASNSVAEVLAANTFLQDTIINTANTILDEFLANVSFVYVGNIGNSAYEQANSANINASAAYDQANLTRTEANAINIVALSAYDKANAANVLAYNVGLGANVISIAAFNKANSTLFTSNLVISVADNSNAALRVTQSGSGPSFVVQDSADPDTTPFVIDSTGNVGIGISSPTAKVDVSGTIKATSFEGDGANLTGIAVIPSNTTMLFVQSTSPTGWTKSTTHDNKALRVVSGAAGSGGTQPFTAAFTSQAVSGGVLSASSGGTISTVTITGTIGSTTLTTSQIPSHNHSIPTSETGLGGGAGSLIGGGNFGYATGSTGGGGSHTHSFTGGSHNHTISGTGHSHGFVGTSIDLSVQYVDVIIATKD